MLALPWLQPSVLCAQPADQSLLDEHLFHGVLFLGAVELENLPLKKDALKELELPFEVKAGMWNQRREEDWGSRCISLTQVQADL